MADLQKKYVLVTGATGFLGSHLTQELLNSGSNVIVLVRNNKKTQQLFQQDQAITICDLNDPGWMESLINLLSQASVETVYHIAAHGNINHSRDDIDSLVDANISLGTKLLEVCALSCPDAHWVWASSFWQFSSNGSKFKANSLYAAAKSCFDTIFDFYKERFDISGTQLVLYDVYGEKDNRNRLLTGLANLICHSSLTGETSKVFELSGGEQQTLFVHVSDVVSAFMTAAKFSKQQTGPYSVSSEKEPSSLKSQINNLLAQYDAKHLVTWGAKPYRQGEVFKIEPFETVPNWRQKFDLEIGFKRLVKSN